MYSIFSSSARFSGGGVNNYCCFNNNRTSDSSNRVGIRLAPNGVFNDMGSEDFREQFLFTAQQLNQYALAYLHVMDGLDFGFHGLGEAMTLKEFRSVFSGALIGNCGYDQASADLAIREGKADLIACNYSDPHQKNEQMN